LHVPAGESPPALARPDGAAMVKKAQATGPARVRSVVDRGAVHAAHEGIVTIDEEQRVVAVAYLGVRTPYLEHVVRQGIGRPGERVLVERQGTSVLSIGEVVPGQLVGLVAHTDARAQIERGALQVPTS